MQRMDCVYRREQHNKFTVWTIRNEILLTVKMNKKYDLAMMARRGREVSGRPMIQHREPE